jgi:hypothetical protein
LIAVLLAPVGLTGGGRTGQVVVERTTYRGWSSCVRLHNETVELVIVPSIGRIMRFGPLGGPNMLWENPDCWGAASPPAAERRDWINYGGDKIWPAPQERWSWPPDPWLDGSPSQVTVRRDDSVIMETPTSETLGLKIRRSIVLSADRPLVSITNILCNAGHQPVEWSIWEVTQVDSPEFAAMPACAADGFPNGYRVLPGIPSEPASLVTRRGKVAEARRNPVAAYKIGSAPDETRLWCRKDGWRFTMAGPRRGGGTYPDGGCNVEIYSNPDPAPYMELEALGPMVNLPAGGSAVMRTSWTLDRK